MSRLQLFAQAALVLGLFIAEFTFAIWAVSKLAAP